LEESIKITYRENVSNEKQEGGVEGERIREKDER
jgi:hypothetical protein